MKKYGIYAAFATLALLAGGSAMAALCMRRLLGCLYFIRIFKHLQ